MYVRKKTDELKQTTDNEMYHKYLEMLKETVVEGSRFVQKVDRYVIIPDSILLAHCTDAVDVLKGLQLPGLEIDMAF
jgi:hypothetical protein